MLASIVFCAGPMLHTKHGTETPLGGTEASGGANVATLLTVTVENHGADRHI
jgi:hypothetical protein